MAAPMAGSLSAAMLAMLGRGAAAALGRARPACSPALQQARAYARPVTRRRRDIPSQLDDLPPTMLKKDYANLPVMNSVDDVVRRLLSLEMASQKEKMKIKTQQLVEKVRRSPNDNGSFEVQVAVLTARIRMFEEHLQRHPKDKNNRRRMLMDMDKRKKLLGYLRRVRYDTFENTCQQLGIQYSLPAPYRRRVTKRWLVKKAFCIKVFQEAQKLKAAERLKERRERRARARAAQGQEKLAQEKVAQEKVAQEKVAQEKVAQEKPAQEKVAQEKVAQEKVAQEKVAQEKPAQEKPAQEKPAQEGTPV